MKYCSTRGGEAGLTFQEALFAGYAADGGLYVPEGVPELTADELEHWATLTYRQLVASVVRKFVDEQEIPTHDLQNVIDSSYKKFKPGEEVTIVEIGDSKSGGKGFWLMELFHGPTLAFKDLTLALVGSLLEYFLAREQKHVSILVGTSGDTGGSAISAIEGRANMQLIVLLPRHRCSQPQYLQMVTSQYKNITVYSVDGTSDDLDIPIKTLFSRQDIVKGHNLLSINSINVGRILGQVTHFLYGYFRMRARPGAPVEVVVPTGAAGNMMAGCLARAMGVPLTILTAVNSNDIVARTVTCGDMSISSRVFACLSSAMDIQIPYNVERILHLYSGRDTGAVAQIMKTFEATGKVNIPQDILDNMNKVITGSCVYDDAAVLNSIRRVYDNHGYLICPHTAQGVTHHYSSPPSTGLPRLYLAPASPAKFPEVVLRALTETVDPLPLSDAQDIVTRMGEPLDQLRELALKNGTHELRMEKGQDWEKILIKKLEEINAAWLK